ncbi:MAG: hypothetical protein ACOYNZ_16275 [Rhodoferax sp.]
MKTASSFGDVSAITDEHVAPANPLQHESKVFGCHHRLPRDHTPLAAEKIRSQLADPFALQLGADGSSAARAEDILRRADAAMYEAKNAGGNTISFS